MSNNVRSSGYNTRSKARRIKGSDSRLDAQAPQPHPRIDEKLPIEIIQLIFELCAPFDNVIHISVCRRLQLYNGHTLIAISHVYSAWRTLVLNMPKLWSRIQLDLRSELKSIYIEAAHTLLSRAVRRNDGCIDLSLSLMMERFNAPLGEHEMISICKLITSFPSRKLDLNLSDVERMQHLLQLPNKVWSNVEELQLKSVGIPRNICPVLFSPGIDLSKLGSLVTNGVLQPDVVVPWHQLWYLDLFKPMSLSNFAESRETSWRRQSGTITLPNVDFLDLNFADGRDVRPFLNLLTMPNLATLRVHNKKCRFRCDEMVFTELACRSGGLKRLKTLDIGDTVWRLDIMLLKRNIPSLL
ncbi:hypothetical protein AX17_002560 [Amanita inopinata Kibby_2008]|nr:hypothetical protein AX17_002560 [Amanita inopinata Kibby_2008]